MSRNRQQGETMEGRVSRLLYNIGGWLSFAVGLLFAVSATYQVVTGGIVGATLAASLALFFVLLGITVTPSIRTRLARRHSPTRFGRVRTVDRRVIRPDEQCEENCVVCGSKVNRGVVRRFRKEDAFAGIPVRTDSVGYNHYCRDCVRAERDGAVTEAESTTADGGRHEPAFETERA